MMVRLSRLMPFYWWLSSVKMGGLSVGWLSLSTSSILVTVNGRGRSTDEAKPKRVAGVDKITFVITLLFYEYEYYELIEWSLIAWKEMKDEREQKLPKNNWIALGILWSGKDSVEENWFHWKIWLDLAADAWLETELRTSCFAPRLHISKETMLLRWLNKCLWCRERCGDLCRFQGAWYLRFDTDTCGAICLRSDGYLDSSFSFDSNLSVSGCESSNFDGGFFFHVPIRSSICQVIPQWGASVLAASDRTKVQTMLQHP